MDVSVQYNASYAIETTRPRTPSKDSLGGIRVGTSDVHLHMRLPPSQLRPLLFPLLLGLAGCTPRAGAERLVLNSTVKRSADIPYGTDARQTLDVYRMRDIRPNAPVVVFIYGGRWKYGAKRDYLLMGNALARQGWVVVIPDYRLFRAVKFPAWVEDGARAVKWTHDNLAQLGGDSTRVFVMGHSAGAHTVAMLALDKHYLRDVGLRPDAVSGYVSIAGPNDTTWTAPDVQELMGPSEGWGATYPYNFVDGSNQPLLLLHGTDDSVVTRGNSERLSARIRARGGCVRLTEYRGLGHIEIALALVLPWLNSATVLHDVVEFVREPTCHPEGASVAEGSHSP